MKPRYALFGTLAAVIAVPSLAQTKPVEPPGGNVCQGRRTDLPQLLPRRQPQVLDDPPRAGRNHAPVQPVPRQPAAQARRQKIEKANQATIRYPVDGKLIGDWKEGEKLAAVRPGGHIGFIQPDPPMTPAAATATPATSWPRRKWPTAPSAPACTTSASCAAIRRDRQVHLRQDLQLQRLHRVHQHAALRAAQLADAGADHPHRRLPGRSRIAREQRLKLLRPEHRMSNEHESS
jgi:hypothetical protein